MKAGGGVLEEGPGAPVGVPARSGGGAASGGQLGELGFPEVFPEGGSGGQAVGGDVLQDGGELVGVQVVDVGDGHLQARPPPCPRTGGSGTTSRKTSHSTIFRWLSGFFEVSPLHRKV